MGFFATDCGYECRGKMHPPSKNRVWGFSASSRPHAPENASQVLEPQRENRPTPTATLSGVRFYGYRYYKPELGRWVNRDPIGEEGGVHVYGFVGNDPVDITDVLGMFIFPPRRTTIIEAVVRNLRGNPDLFWSLSLTGVRIGDPLLQGDNHGWAAARSIGQCTPVREIEKVSDCCARVKRNYAYRIDLRPVVIDESYVGDILTARGWRELRGHELRHARASLNGFEAYYGPIAGNGWAATRCGTVCDKAGYEKAAEKLSNYLDDSWSAVRRLWLRYEGQEWGSIDRERWVYDDAGRKDYLTNIHTIRTPPPLTESGLPDCPQSE